MKMKTRLFICMMMSLVYQFAFAGRVERINYIEQFKQIAIQEMHRTGIPASIKMAQAILESNSGTSTLAKRANNHFGIKCGGNWDGRSYYRKDDDYKRGKLIKSCFRAYPSVEASFIAHSDFLTSQNRYRFLFRYDIGDYKAWAYGLKKAGYASDPRYPKLLIGLIRDYQLDRLDQAQPNFTPVVTNQELWMSQAVNPTGYQNIKYVNGLKVAVAEAGYTPEDISLNTGVNIRQLLRFNENLTDAHTPLPENAVVFLESKAKKFKGKKKIHVTKSQETIEDISTRYGVSIAALYKRNRMVTGTQPAEGFKIFLKGKSPKHRIPRIRTDDLLVTLPNDTDTGKVSKISADTGRSSTVVNHHLERKSTEQKELIYYEVKSGDSLYGISKKFDISIKDLKRFNNLEGDLIKIGQKLKVSL